jgi:hypothetical protein
MGPIKLFLFGEARLAYGTRGTNLALIADEPRPSCLSGAAASRSAARSCDRCNVARSGRCQGPQCTQYRTLAVAPGSAGESATWRYDAAISGGEVRFDPPAQRWIDVTAFERGVGKGLDRTGGIASPETLIWFQQALALYTADFLEGYYYDWVQPNVSACARSISPVWKTSCGISRCAAKLRLASPLANASFNSTPSASRSIASSSGSLRKMASGTRRSSNTRSAATCCWPSSGLGLRKRPRRFTSA